MCGRTITQINPSTSRTAICTTNTSTQFPTTNNLISAQCDQLPLSPIIVTYMSNQFLRFLHCVTTDCVTDVSKKAKCLPAYTTYILLLPTQFKPEDAGSKLLWNFWNKPTATWHKIPTFSILTTNHCQSIKSAVILNVCLLWQIAKYRAIYIWG